MPSSCLSLRWAARITPSALFSSSSASNDSGWLQHVFVQWSETCTENTAAILTQKFGSSQLPGCINQCRSSGSISDARWELWHGNCYITNPIRDISDSHHAFEPEPELLHWPMHYRNCDKLNEFETSMLRTENLLTCLSICFVMNRKFLLTYLGEIRTFCYCFD